ncbi:MULTISPECIES: hypothetical protein [Kocuria]|uniref:hypothetical protein n=1 Tax=Kocuria TaxID=57493 RepID=UPI00159634B2|nr:MULTISPECIES: hypothetical protein [Kocuria]
MDDPRRFSGWYGDQLEEPAVLVGPDDQEAVFALVLVLDQTDRIYPRVLDVGVVDAVLPRGSPNLHFSNVPDRPGRVKMKLTPTAMVGALRRRGLVTTRTNGHVTRLFAA